MISSPRRVDVLSFPVATCNMWPVVRAPLVLVYVMSLVCLLSFLCVFVCAQLVQVMVGGATSARALAADLMQQSIRLQQASMRLRGMLLRGEVDRERVIVREIMAEVSGVLEDQARACLRGPDARSRRCRRWRRALQDMVGPSGPLKRVIPKRPGWGGAKQKSCSGDAEVRTPPRRRWLPRGARVGGLSATIFRYPCPQDVGARARQVEMVAPRG